VVHYNPQRSFITKRLRQARLGGKRTWPGDHYAGLSEKSSGLTAKDAGIPPETQFLVRKNVFAINIGWQNMGSYIRSFNTVWAIFWAFVHNHCRKKPEPPFFCLIYC